MAKSVEEQLEENAAAISAVEARGQRFTIKDREVWRADHKSLTDRQDKLERKLARQRSGGVRVTRIVPL